jgi:hypothetical protein
VWHYNWANEHTEFQPRTMVIGPLFFRTQVNHFLLSRPLSNLCICDSSWCCSSSPAGPNHARPKLQTYPIIGHFQHHLALLFEVTIFIRLSQNNPSWSSTWVDLSLYKLSLEFFEGAGKFGDLPIWSHPTQMILIFHKERSIGQNLPHSAHGPCPLCADTSPDIASCVGLRQMLFVTCLPRRRTSIQVSYNITELKSTNTEYCNK